MTTISANQFKIEVSKGNEVKDYLVNDDSVVIESYNGLAIRSCRFTDIHFENPLAPIILEQCEAITLSINGSMSPKIHLKNCKFQSVEISWLKVGNSEHGSTDLVIEGSETIMEQVTFIGIYRRIELNNTTNITQIDFNFIDANEVNVNEVMNSRLNFTNVKIRKTAMFLSTNNVHLEFFSSETYYIGVLTPNNLKVDFISAKSDSITFSDGTYDSISFQGTGEYDFHFAYSPIYRQETIINRLKLTNFTLLEKKKIKLLDVGIEEVVASDFENNGTLTFNNCEVSSRFEITASNMGKTHFNNVHVENAEIIITNANITDCLFTNFKWRSDYRINRHAAFDQLPSVRETYRQLKATYQKNGNKIESLEFQKHELDTHYEILNNIKPKGWFTRDRGNYLIVWTNKWSSDFGQNIWRPFALLIFVHLLMFNILILSNPNLGVGFGFHHDWAVFWNGVNYYFQSLLPVRTTEIRLATNERIPINGTIDFFMRLFSGYFIYYFLTATRKYHQ